MDWLYWRRGLGIALPIILFLSGVSHAHAQDDSVLPRVVVEAVQQLPLESHVSTYGTLSPKTEELSFRIGGRISRFLVEEGSRVTKGQLLAQLDLQDARDNVNQRKVELDQAARQLQRMETLHSNGSIQKSQLEDARDRHEQARIAHEQAAVNLDRCYLRASSDGLILREFVESRTTVTAGQPIYAFQSESEEWVTRVNLTDRNAFALGEGADAEVRFAPYPGVTFSGSLTKLARVANPGDSLYSSEITIINQGHELRPGMIAEVDLSRRSEETYTTVPLDALLDLRGSDGRIFLYDSAGGDVLEQQVTVKAIVGTRVSLVEALPDAGYVVTGGHGGLRDGIRVEVVGGLSATE